MKKQKDIFKKIKSVQKTKKLLSVDIYKIVKQFLRAEKESNNTIEYNKHQFGNCAELINRMLRSYVVPTNRIYISEQALEELNEYGINAKEINKVITNGYKSYNGESKVLSKFNKKFTADHVIPISMIKDEAIKLFCKNKFNEIAFNSLLNKITLCIMLKEEHESIKEKSKRFLNVKKVINDIYKNKYNIKVTKLQNII